MKDRKEYDRMRYALKRELKIDKTGVEPRQYKRFNQEPTYKTTDVFTSTTLKEYPQSIKIQLDYARQNYTPDQYASLLKLLD